VGRFDGQNAIVTGAGGGIGRAHALLLAAEGAAVVVNDYGGDTSGTPGTSARADAVVEEIRASGGTAIADGSDVSGAGEAIVARAVDAFGGLHIVINNAGISGGGTLDTISPADFERMLAIHLGGTVGVCRAAWPHLRRQRYGRIVNTSSGSVFGLPGTSAYITAKAAIFGFTRALARDGLDFDVKVNAIMPVADSRLNVPAPVIGPLTKAAFPTDQIAPFVGALLSREVPCTGETFVVGAGRAARVVLATVPGFRGGATIDDYLAHFDEALATESVFIPHDAMDELRYECAQLAIDYGAFLSRSGGGVRTRPCPVDVAELRTGRPVAPPGRAR
jgi:NAD(P)-dependent dehydrogenase (short-subunit alcohol dehydrogenase family)